MGGFWEGFWEDYGRVTGYTVTKEDKCTVAVNLSGNKGNANLSATISPYAAALFNLWAEIPPTNSTHLGGDNQRHTCKIQLRVLTWVRNSYKVVRFAQFKRTKIGRPITVEDA